MSPRAAPPREPCAVRRPPPPHRIATLLLLALAFAACATPGVSLEYYRDLDRRLQAGDFAGAEARLAASRNLYGERADLLYRMDAAMIATLAGDPARGNREIAAAEILLEALSTKSVSAQAVSLLSSDATLPYQGEEYERVFLNVLGALNYAVLGQPDDAIVEAKRADLKLAEAARAHPDSAWRDDPFVRYLMGLIYEDGGELNDAWVSYARALHAYAAQAGTFGVRPPPGLVRCAASAAARLGFREELADLRATSGGEVPEDPATAGTGRIVLVEFAGPGPYKVENRLEITLAYGLPFVTAQQVTSKEQADVSTAMTVAKSVAGTNNIVIAFPTMTSRPPAGPVARLTVAGRNAPAELATDVGAVARKVLEEHTGRIWGRMVARAVVKFLLALGVEKAGEAAGGSQYGWIAGMLAGMATRAALGAMEHADTRGWGTLPSVVRVAVAEVPPGTQAVDVEAGGRAWSTTAAVRAGRTTWMLARTP